jgi:predicted outer membrane repeat protein
MDMRTRIGFTFLASVVTLLLLAVAGFGTAMAGNIYVNINAVGANNGTNWADAYTDLQSALAEAVSGDTIYVAEGTYKPTSGYDRTISFELNSGVKLWGGYSGTGDESRDPAFKTILSGDIGIPGDKSDNSYHVVKWIAVDYTAVTEMDGFTITAGNANGPWDDSSGYANSKGGGMYIYEGSPALTNVIFSNNSAMYGGGGLYAQYGGSTLTDVTFSGNTTGIDGKGGAISLYASHPTLINVTISGNSAGIGGGISLDSNCEWTTLTHVTISGNTATTSGGGWYFYDDNDNMPDSNPLVRNSILWGNTPNQADYPRGNAYFIDSVVQGGCPDPDPYPNLHCTKIIAADPKLGTLGDNGGYTQTIPLLAGSSAIDAGLNYGVKYDQRGVARPQGLGFDIGAYEVVNQPPVALCKDVTAAAGPSCTGVASIDNGSSDPDGDSITLAQSPAGPYPKGNTLVTLTVTDSKGASSQCTGTVTVLDTTPPSITSYPVNIVTSTDPGQCTAVVNYNVTAMDNCPGVTAGGNPPSGSAFPKGTTTVIATATDTSGNTATRSFTVTVANNQPPAITGASANPSVLWPPNKKMVDVTVNYSAADNCSQPACQISSVTCNEPISSSNYTIVDGHHVKLSADRLGSGNGRIYTISITCADASGNSSSQAVKVTVPHDQGKK